MKKYLPVIIILLVLNFGCSTSLNMVGFYFVGKKKIDTALKVFNTSVSLNSNNYETYFYRGSIFRVNQNFEKALNDADKALAINPEYDKAYYLKGLIYSETNQHEKAINEFSKALKINPNNGHYYGDRGFSKFLTDQNDEAISDLDIAIVLLPENTDYLLYRIAAYTLKEEGWDLIISDCNRAIKLNHPTPHPYKFRALAYGRQANYEKAVQDYDKFIALVPTEYVMFLRRGTCLFELDNFEKALKDFEKYLLFCPPSNKENIEFVEGKIDEIKSIISKDDKK